MPIPYIADASIPMACATVRQSATLTVAASNSLHRERADYVCDGVNDQVQIQAAIDALPPGGGQIKLHDGLYIKGAGTITITKDCVDIHGSGKNTKIELADNLNADASIFMANNKKAITISDMVLDGNWEHQTSGQQYGVIFSGCSETKIDCWIENFKEADQKIDSLVYGNSTEKVTFINRNYSEDYMPIQKDILKIEGVEGWTIVEGSATLSDEADSLFGNNSLRVTVPSNGSVTIEHDLDTDLRFYPLINLLAKFPEESTRIPVEGFKIAFLDSDGNKVISHSNYDWISRGIQSWLDVFEYYHFDVSSFDWSEKKYWILGDIKKIQIIITASSSGFVSDFNHVAAFRGLPIPVKTFIHDDNGRDRWAYALPEALDLGVRFCCAINSSVLGHVDSSTWDEIRSLYLVGIDIITHSATHWWGISGETERDIRYGGNARKEWEWLAGRAQLERHGIRTGIFFAYAGGHHANEPRFWRKACVMGRTQVTGGLRAALPYGISRYSLPYGGASLDNVARFHLWAISADHATSAGVFATRANACKSRGIQIATFSQMYLQYPSCPDAHLNNLCEKIEHDYRLKTNQDMFLNLLAADNDLISGAAGWNGTGSKQEITSFSGQPDYPRNASVTLTGANGGEIEIYGPDARGYEVSDVISISAGETKYTYATFTKITKVVIPADLGAGDNIKVGISDKLGLSHWFLQWDDVKKVVTWNAGGTSEVALSEDMFRTWNAGSGSVFWEAAIDLSNITAGDNFIIYYMSEL